MARATYVPEELGKEVIAPSGYYTPLEEAILDYDGKSLLYVRGTGCIEASCCGAGSWGYLRVEGYLSMQEYSQYRKTGTSVAVNTVEDEGEKAGIAKLLLTKYPGARIEFR